MRLDPFLRMLRSARPWPTLRRGVLGGLLLLLAACASAPHRREPTFRASHSGLADLPARAPSAAMAGEANDVLFRAIGLVGTPYRWGGNTPAGGFDCSGLIDYIYRGATGLQLPRTSQEMAAMDAKMVRQMTQLASGDLVFFDIDGRISHVGVYVGKGRFVHAPNSGGTVRLDALDGDYWRQHYDGAKRLFR